MRRLKGAAKGPITVLFKGGTYYLPDTVVFTAEDSGTTDRPIIYAASPGEKVVVSGGAKVRSIRDRNEMSAVGLGGTDGVLLVDVKPGSGAEGSGLKTNDVIVAIDGRKVKGLKEFAGMYKRIGKGGEVELAVWRDQAEMKIRLRK